MLLSPVVLSSWAKSVSCVQSQQQSGSRAQAGEEWTSGSERSDITSGHYTDTGSGLWGGNKPSVVGHCQGQQLNSVVFKHDSME